MECPIGVSLGFFSQMKKPPILFSTQAYLEFTNRLAEHTGFKTGSIEVRTFPDGERYQRIATNIAERHVVLVGGTISDCDTLALYDLGSSLVKYGAKSFTLVIPYFGYSTMERATRSGEVVTAKTRARLFSSIPQASRGNRVILVDLHTEGLPHYFEGGLVPYHLYAKPVILEAARALGGNDFVLACTDAGRAKWVESLANDLGVEPAFVFKQRLDGSTTRVTGVSARVSGKTVVIYDDMIRTGGSLTEAARTYLEAGASRILAITTHGVLPEGSVEKLAGTGLFERIIVTDSHARVERIQHPLIEVRSIAPLLAEYLLQLFSPA